MYQKRYNACSPNTRDEHAVVHSKQTIYGVCAFNIVAMYLSEAAANVSVACQPRVFLLDQKRYSE